jgi:hypothetical protein
MSTDSGDAHPSIQALASMFAELEPLILRFRVREEYLPGDLTMQAYLLAAWDNAKSTEALLRATDLGIGPFVCARSAFEAAQSAALLASEPDYAAAGARARAFEVLEYYLERSRWTKTFPENSTADADPEFESAIRLLERYAAIMDRCVAGAGEPISIAIAEWLPEFRVALEGNKNQKTLHWSGFGQRRIAEQLAARKNQPALTEQLPLLYSMLSRYSHPRAHPEGWKKNPGGGPLFILSDSNRLQAARAVVVALVLVREAVLELQPDLRST